MRIDVTIPYRFTCKKKGARKETDMTGEVAVQVDIPAHAGPVHEVGRFGMPGRRQQQEAAGVLRPDSDDWKGVFTEIDGRARKVLFFDNDFWVEIGSTDDIQERMTRREEESLDPFSVSRDKVYLFGYASREIVDPDALRASGQIKVILSSEENAYKAAAVDRARLDMRTVGDLVVMRTAEPVITAIHHNRYGGAQATECYEIVVVPSNSKTSTGFEFIGDPGRIASFGHVPLHRRDELEAEVREHADKVAAKGGERTVEQWTGSWRNRRKRRVKEKFDVDVTVIDTVVAEVTRPELLAFDDFSKKASSAAWRLGGEETRQYLKQMSKEAGLSFLRLMDVKEASRRIVTPQLVRALKETSEQIIEGFTLTLPKRVPGSPSLNIAGIYHSMDEESGKIGELKQTAAEMLEAFEQRVPGRDWFDIALDAAADFRDGFSIGEICTLTDARTAAAALGESDISDLALEAAKGNGHLIGVIYNGTFHGVLHLTGTADKLEIEKVFAKAGYEEMVVKAAGTFIERVRADASVEENLDFDLGAPAFSAA